MMEIKTIRYLPKHIGNIEEFKRICKAYDEELKALWRALDTQLSNQNMDEMDSDTCDRWAHLLNLTFQADDTIEDKRRLIRGKMASGLPYTEPKIREVISSMVGEHYYTWELDRTGKILRVGIMLASVMNLSAVTELVRAMAPADMVVEVYISFNRWRRFQTETWGSLWNHGSDTWNDVKNNVKWQS